LIRRRRCRRKKRGRFGTEKKKHGSKKNIGDKDTEEVSTKKGRIRRRQ
jgi:hypothetical protein